MRRDFDRVLILGMMVGYRSIWLHGKIRTLVQSGRTGFSDNFFRKI